MQPVPCIREATERWAVDALLDQIVVEISERGMDPAELCRDPLAPNLERGR
jgi:hypothetical protein